MSNYIFLMNDVLAVEEKKVEGGALAAILGLQICCKCRWVMGNFMDFLP